MKPTLNPDQKKLALQKVYYDSKARSFQCQEIIWKSKTTWNSNERRPRLHQEAKNWHGNVLNFQKLICNDDWDEKIVEDIMAYSTKQEGTLLVLDDMITYSYAVNIKRGKFTEPTYHKATFSFFSRKIFFNKLSGHER